ncbi:unnamed protein product [Strongylus vulgaris]|uniref:Uncharacterized protein n=1 Tax=Strongylus vulgaris TaxID=40348 RepID=A0A3P7IZN7_STRVU|nr:unnamed protein product [Strongylus vulgaris]
MKPKRGGRAEGQDRQASKKKLALPPGIKGMIGRALAAEFAPIASTIYQCMDLQCLCTYLRGSVAPNGQCSLPNGQMLRKAIRKEYRMMSDDELQRYHAAVRQLKQVWWRVFIFQSQYSPGIKLCFRT